MSLIEKCMPNCMHVIGRKVYEKIEKCMQNCMHVIDRKVYAKLYACH